MKPTTTPGQTTSIPTIFIGGIPLDICKAELVSYLEKFGPVDSVEIACERKRKKNRQNGFAKAVFVWLKDAQGFLAQSIHSLRGLVLGVKVWTDKGEHVRSKLDLNKKRLFVRHHQDLTEEDLIAHFKGFGEIDGVDLKLDHVSRTSRRFAFILFKTEEARCEAELKGSLSGIERFITCEPCVPTTLMKRLDSQGGSSQSEHGVLSCHTADAVASGAPRANNSPNLKSYEPGIVPSSRITFAQVDRQKNNGKTLKGAIPTHRLGLVNPESLYSIKPTSVLYHHNGHDSVSVIYTTEDNLTFRIGSPQRAYSQPKLYKLFF